MAKKLKTTPRGTAVYPYLNQPDFGSKKFKTPQGVYRVKLRMDADDAAPIIEMIDKAAEESFKEAKTNETDVKKRKKLRLADPPYEELDDGSYEIQFKGNASGTREDKTTWEWHPQFFDIKGRAIAFEDVPNIGGGTVMKVSFFLKPYSKLNGKDCGVSIKLKAVQIIKLVEFGQATAEECGFGEEEAEDGDSGFDSTKAKPKQQFEDESAEDDDDDDADDTPEDDGGDESLDDF